MSHLSVHEIKTKIAEEIDRRGDMAISTAKKILGSPESGFKENIASQYVADQLHELGLYCDRGLGITGLRATIDSGKPGPTVGIIGELDSMIIKNHPYGDPTTDAAHACGHHVQIGSMMAAAIGLLSAEVMENLAGKVVLLAVPAEEYIEIEYRQELRAQGKIEFLSGKQEFIRLGYMDNVDIAMMVHTIPQSGEAKFVLVEGNNGFMAKTARFLGKAAHAGASPHDGVNSLNAAMIAMSAIHAQRETYRNEDTVRIHPIITQGGVSVSSVPADVHLETFVRGKTVDAFMDAGQKVDRALRAGAMAVGGSVTISSLPGHLPLSQDSRLTELFIQNARKMVGSDGIVTRGQWTGSTDMGDLSQIMPCIHPYVSAAQGIPHGADYLVIDYELGVLTSGKVIAMTIVDLLVNGGRTGISIMNRFRASMTKTGYLSYLRGAFLEEIFVEK